MKKISLFKRLLSGIAAAALAATICFGDRVFGDLFASAATDPTVVVKVLNEGKPITYDGDSDNANVKYYVLGALFDKSAGNVEATAQYEKNIVAWDCKEINPKSAAESVVTFDNFYKNDNDHTKFDRDQEKVKFDSAKHKFVACVYRYWVTGDLDYNPYSTKGVEPTNLVAPQTNGVYTGNVWGSPWLQTFQEHSEKTFDGYDVLSSTSENTTTITINKHINYFKLKVNFSKPTTVTDDDNLYALIEVERKDNPYGDDKVYAMEQINIENSNTIEYTIQDGSNGNEWKDINDSDANYQYNGSDNVKVRLFQSVESRKISQLVNGDGVTELKTGDYVKTQKVDIKDSITSSAGQTYTNYIAAINLLKADSSDNYDYVDILGSGIAFGITADRFALKNHAQTNFATNYFANFSDNIDPDLSSPSAGEIYLANFAKLTDPTDISKDTEKKLVIGDTKGVALVVHVEDQNRVQLNDPSNVTIQTIPGQQITDEVVNPVIQQMQAMSNRLASKPANVTVIKANSRYNVNTLDYPDDATVYVDGDALAENGEFVTGAGFIFKITKKENQTIVFNFKNTKKVTLDSFETTVVDKDGKVIYDNMDSSPDGQRNSDRNIFLDQQIMRRIVWNLNSVSSTNEEFKDDTPCVTLKNTAGLFLIPNAQSVTQIPGTSTGWLLSAGYVENNGGEWHFPYSNLSKYEKPKTSKVTISKKAVTGEDELEGATIQIVDQVEGNGISDTLWDYLKEQNEDTELVKTSDGKHNYGIQWTSGSAPKTITLRDGAYTLKETGTEFTSDGKKYKVVTSTVNFEITNGKITKTPKNVTEKNGSITYDADSNTITISDALADGPQKFFVHINKTDVTGELELEGAKLTVYKAKADGTKGEMVQSSVSSKNPGSVWNIYLEPGDYILEETAGNSPITDAQGRRYDVIDSTVKFTVDKDGKVTSQSAKKDFDNKPGAVLTTNENNEQILVISDALTKTKVTINKTDITGNIEVKGAKLKLIDKKTGKQVGNTWESGKDGTKWEVSLLPGTYVLSEEPSSVVTDDKGNTYLVISSEYEFTVGNDGKITESVKVSTNEGKITLSGNVITVMDAMKSETSYNVHINKTDITGQTEVEGAVLTIKDKDGKFVGKWTSKKGAAWKIALEPGEYTLTETAANGKKITDENGIIYKVLDSEVKFTVGKDGKVTSTTAKNSFDEVGNEGAVLTKDNNGEQLLVVCDAAASGKIKLNKTDVTGEKELDNAKITITKDGKTVKEWVSKRGVTEEFVLEDGTYTLTETAAEGKKIVDEDGNEYDVINSSVTFTVKNGKVSSKTAKTEHDATSKTGYVVVKDNQITISDAKKVKASDTSSQSKPSQSETAPSQTKPSQMGSSSSQSEQKPSQSVSTPSQTEPEQTGSVSNSSQSEQKPSQSVSTPGQTEPEQTGSVSNSSQSEQKPSQSVSTPSQTAPTMSSKDPEESNVKPATTPGSNSTTEGTTTTTKSTGDKDGTTTTTTKTSTTTTTTTTTSSTTTETGENPPQTGHTGSTVTVAALLTAVAALAIFKKKDD